MTDTSLKNCPFCVGEGEITPHVHALALKAVVCDQCSSSSGWYLHEEEAIAAWNRRTPPAAVPEPWGWLCNGKGDGWEERDKVVRDPELIARYRERPDLWRIEPLYLGSPPAAVPDGWVLVPKEPTREMAIAAAKALDDITVDDPKAAAWDAMRAYRAMLSAAPTPPVDDGWRLAETAPDDTEVFAWSPKYGGIYLAIKQDGEWRVPDLHPSNWEPIDAPTHWMPLPAAPTEARDE